MDDFDFSQFGPQLRSSSTRSAGDRIGRLALAAAVVAWVAWSIGFAGILVWLPRAFNLGGIIQLTIMACWPVACVGGLAAALGWWNKEGLIAVVLSLLLLVGTFCLVLLMGNPWLD
jgi:hypothetical protein